MVNWASPVENEKDYIVFQNTIFTLFGLYLWELLTTWNFEWSLLTRRRKFRWPLIFFFLSRYCILLAFIGLILSFSDTAKINCVALYTFNSWTGNMAILCSSTSLMLRTIALWERKLKVVIPLVVLCLGHWAVLYRGMFIVTATWDDTRHSCLVTQTTPSLLTVTFFFTMGFDFVILVFTFIALYSKHSARTDLWKLLFQDGLIYFLVSFTTNCIPAVLNVLNLNNTMNVIATVPAACVSSVAACRAVMRLLEFNTSDVYVHTVSAITNSFSARPSPAAQGLRKPSKYTISRPAEVHVTTEHITTAEYALNNIRSFDDKQYLEGLSPSCDTSPSRTPSCKARQNTVPESIDLEKQAERDVINDRDSVSSDYFYSGSPPR